jgi:hypothetical protein
MSDDDRDNIFLGSDSLDSWTFGENLHTSFNLEDDAPGAAPIVKDVKNIDVWMTVGVGSATLYVEEFPLLWREEMRGGDFHMHCIGQERLAESIAQAPGGKTPGIRSW